MWVYEFFHVIIGILWIGLLYFFNLVQVQSMPKMVEAGAAKPYTQIILPKALFLFRHAALWTVITGIAYYIAGRGVVQGIPSGEIMIGMLLGIIMAGNVWFIIWPNQKKIIAGELEGEEGGLREEGRGQTGVDHKGSGKCDRKGVHRGGIPGDYEIARKQPRRGFQADDDDERCTRREKPEETALKRQARTGRAREGGTQGGKTADAPDD